MIAQSGLCWTWSESWQTGFLTSWLILILAATSENQQSANATQINYEVTAQLISAFVFATYVVQFLFLNTRFKVSSKSASVTAQAGLCQTWSEIQIVVFLHAKTYVFYREKYVYLMGRSPLPINSNYYILDQHKWKPTSDQVVRYEILPK